MPERYCVPVSFPCRMPCVGSWFSQNSFSSESYETAAGSKTTRTTSLCPVQPVQTSRYVGFGVEPAAWPTAVVKTPLCCQNFFSAPQKQPIPKSARCIPSGNGGSNGWPLTKCAVGTSVGFCSSFAQKKSGSSGETERPSCAIDSPPAAA